MNEAAHEGNAPRHARARVRAELTREIKDTARQQLAEAGAAALSLRAVARELGMASSALYRYFPSRDELLTALIVDAYDAIGATAEAADAGCPRDQIGKRWQTVCRAVRRWALDHSHEYALIYGSPVPGYRAPPETTVPPATRVTRVLSDVLRDAAAAGALDPGAPGLPLPASVAADARQLQATLLAGVSEAAVVRGLIAWTHLFGAVSFELFGQYQNTISNYDEYFDYTVGCVGRFLGLPDARATR